MKKSASEILGEVQAVFREVLARPALVLTPATTAGDVPEWDSFNHLILITEVEQHFGVKFSLRDVMRFRNVGDMCALIETKLQSSSGPSA
jgi:acyl carrier protein